MRCLLISIHLNAEGYACKQQCDPRLAVYVRGYFTLKFSNWMVFQIEQRIVAVMMKHC